MGGTRILTDEELAEACELREAGKPFTWISRHFAAKGTKVSAGSLSWHCLMQGADAPPEMRQACGIRPGTVMKRGDHVVRTFTPQEDERLLELEAEGLGYTEIGRRIGRKPNSVRGRLATLARHDARAEFA